MAPAASGGGLFGAGGSKAPAPASFGAEKPKSDAPAGFGALRPSGVSGGLFSQPKKPDAPQQ